MKAIDIRSESAVKLLAEFLDMDAQPGPGNLRANAEHFAHGELNIRSLQST
jgi:E3 ubiquitin-protein ligase Topors